MDTWRLLLTPPARGAWNMAVDEALLESVGRGESLPALRLYAWQPPCLSLGYAQPFSDVDIPRLKERGWELVRRPTGGRAILHTDELTYSVIAPPDEPRLAGTLLESYNHLAQALLAALRLLGLPVEMQERSAASQAGNTNPVCFEAPSTYEITVGGKKLVGSAQARRKEGVLQHGSLPLTGDLARLIDCLTLPEAEADALRRSLAGHAITAEAAAGRPISFAEAMAALEAGFAAALAITLVSGALTEAEQTWAAELARDKYAHPEWTGRP